LQNDPDSNGREGLIRRLSDDRKEFRSVRASLTTALKVLTPNDCVYRARTNPEGRSDPWPSHDMRGNPEYPAQRANLKGQPILYCAESKATAICEVRPPQGVTLITIAILKPMRNLRLVSAIPRANEPQRSHFRILNEWLSRPVVSLDDLQHYWQTQLFSCIVRVEGYDGIEFSSSLEPNGINYALFDPFCVDLLNPVAIRHEW
jgi:hypothetical protein